MRLGIYTDAQYREADGQVLSDPESFAFLHFGCEVGRHFEGLVLIGRGAPPESRAQQALPGAPELAALPWYESLASLGAVARAAVGTARGMWRALDRIDVVWIFGPHPFALLLAAMALVRRRGVVLGARQDTMSYFRTRLRSPRSAWLLAPLRVMDETWRLLARRVLTTVVGTALEERYGGPRRGLEPIVVSTVREADVADAPPAAPSGDEVRLLTVGRLEPEKAPETAVAALAALQGRDGRSYHLTWVGAGKLADETRAAAERLGVADKLDLAGFVPFGPALLERYRTADLFVHVAVTEGAPQVVLEALATGLPLVATAVGGVRAAVDGGAAARLVPPASAEALADAVAETVADDEGRRRRAEHGLDLARSRSLEREAARVAALIRSGRA